MRLSTLSFIFRETATNIRRNVLMSLACVTTVAVTLGFSGFVVLGFRNAENLLHHLAQELVVAAYLNTDTTPVGRDSVGRAIGGIPHVQGPPALVSKEHAWRVFSATIPDSLKGEMDGNPLPDTFMVRVDTPIHVPAVARQIAALPDVEKVNAPYLEAQRASAILRFVGLATTTVTFLLVFVTAFLVMNTIRLTLYARRHEIRVMQLVGATNGYIRTPFILEGLTLGALGGAVACACLAVGYPYLLHIIRAALAFDLPLINPGRGMLPFYGQIAGIGAAVGAFGSLISVRRFLRPVEYEVTVRRLRPKDLKQIEEERARQDAEMGDPSTNLTRNYTPRGESGMLEEAIPTPDFRVPDLGPYNAGEDLEQRPMKGDLGRKIDEGRERGSSGANEAPGGKLEGDSAGTQDRGSDPGGKARTRRLEANAAATHYDTDPDVVEI